MEEVRSLDPSNPFAGGSNVAGKQPSTKRRASYDDASFTDENEPARRSPVMGGESTAMGHTRSLTSSEGPASQRNLTGRRVTSSSSQPRVPYAGTFAPNPSFIRLLRFSLYGLASLSALITAGFAISVVQYYNAHEPSIKPSWGSLIALIVFGIITPGGLFGTFLVTPRLFRYGTFAGIVNQVRMELLMLFAFAVIWVSGALAMASDLRGYENCIWDGYYHYPKPTNFHHVCDLINITVIMGYLTFGLVTLAWVVVTFLAIYILLYLDQEVLSELTNDMGGRAYRARTYALALQQQRQQAYARNNEMSEKGAYTERSHRRTQSAGSQRQPEPDHASRRLPSFGARGPRSEDEESLGSSNGGGPMMRVSTRERELEADRANET